MSKMVALAALLAISHVLAAPGGSVDIDAAETRRLADLGLVLLDKKVDAAGGVLTILGADPANTTATTQVTELEPKLHRRCGSNRVTCDTAWGPTPATCWTLVESTRDNQNPVTGDPRSVCYTLSGNKCCISWGTAIGSVRLSDLHAAARATYDKCVNSFAQSGLAADVSINNRCLKQCLSNRETGCPAGQ